MMQVQNVHTSRKFIKGDPKCEIIRVLGEEVGQKLLTQIYSKVNHKTIHWLETIICDSSNFTCVNVCISRYLMPDFEGDSTILSIPIFTYQQDQHFSHIGEKTKIPFKRSYNETTVRYKNFRVPYLNDTIYLYWVNLDNPLRMKIIKRYVRVGNEVKLSFKTSCKLFTLKLYLKKLVN